MTPAAATIEIEDITTDATNRNILRRLKENDPNFVEMSVSVAGRVAGGTSFSPTSARDMGWLGYFISKNTNLRELNFQSNLLGCVCIDAIESFCRGVNSNRSIEKIRFDSMDLSGGEIFQSLRPIFENSRSMSEFEATKCSFGSGCARELSLVLRNCYKSLKSL